MFINIEYLETSYTRKSKLGKEHNYVRLKTVAVFRCDNCKNIFKREKGKINPKRLSNNYFHCCSLCDSKRFAQKKGAERRTIWNMPVSSLNDISQL